MTNVETATVLEARGVTKRFGGLVAVDDASLSVAKGEVLGLVGPNGAGKTTLLSCMAGAMPIDRGMVTLLGKDIGSMAPEDRCRLGLARTFQVPRPFPRLTAIQNIMVATTFGRVGGTRKHPEERARELLEFVQFRHPENTLAAGLNAVDLKRLELARALGSDPAVILMDELAAGLMTGQLPELISIIKRMSDMGVAVIMVEHVMSQIAGLCHRVVCLHFGKKVLEGTPKEILADPLFAEIYLGGDLRKEAASA